MRHPVAAPVLLALLLALSAPLAQAATAMPQPAPAADARWTYETSLHFDEVVNATATTRMTGVETVEAGGAQHQAYRMETVHAGRREGETVVTWYRVSDFAKVKVAFLRPTGQTNYTLAQPCGELRFPMTVDASWSTSCVFREDDGNTFTIHSNWSVVRAERVTVPAGAYEAVVLEQRGDTFTERWWFAPDACWWVRHESLGEAGELQSQERLTAVEGCEPQATTPPGTTPAGATPTPTAASPTPTGATPTGAAPTTASPTPGGATTPGGTSPAGVTPTGSATGGDATNGGTPEDPDATPGIGAAALVLALLGAALVLRRRG